MAQEKYLFWFRFCFPIDWTDKDAHEIQELFFIIANSEKEALNWGNKIVENFIEKLFTENNYRSEKMVFTSFIWEDWENAGEDERKELASFPVINYGDLPSLNFEIRS